MKRSSPARTGVARTGVARTGVARTGEVGGRRFVLLLVGVAVVVTGWTAVGIHLRAIQLTTTTADEPQYLLSAISLYEDHDLDISDELAARRYEPFHEATVLEQTKLLDDGRRVSPHDPLLPVVLAVPMGLGGWVAAKAMLAVLAGILAASLLWVAVRRFSVPVTAAALTVLAFSLAAPLTAYGTQVYPELPAALVVTAAIGAVAGAMRRWGLALFTAALVALPWLSVKYAPVALALVLVGGWKLWTSRRVRSLVVMVGALVLAGVAFLVVHRIVYTGWTAYAAGDHFVGGELTVVGTQANYPGRSIRLLGLLVDRTFGLAAWAPVFLLVVPALAALVRRRPPGWSVLVAVLAAGWANATWVALTMHGWWWPGRQVVVVVPAIVLVIAWWVGRCRAALPWLVGLGALGIVTWLWLEIEVLAGDRFLVFDFHQTTNPWFRFWSAWMPDGRSTSIGDAALFVAWGAVLVVLSVIGWRSVPDPDDGLGRADQDAGAGEGADPHVMAVDLDGGGAVG